MALRGCHWFVALGLAASFHIVALLLFYQPAAKIEGGAREVGMTGFEIALGPASGSLANSKAVTESGEMVEEVVPQEIEQRVEQSDVVEIEPPPVVKEMPTLQPEIMPESKPQVAETPALESQAEPSVEPKSEPEVATAILSAKPKAADESNQAVKTVKAVKGVNGKQAVSNEQVVNNGDGSAGGGIPGAKKDYFSLLSTWLEKHKQYPRSAQRRRQEGTAYLRFVIDRTGQVLSYQVERSSGHRLLDREVERIILRAAPLPAMPSEMTLSKLELVVPFSFYTH